MTTPTSRPDTPLERMSFPTRRRLVKTLWFITPAGWYKQSPAPSSLLR
jgi:hypothetical protein